jgi:hypothetical protein
LQPQAEACGSKCGKWINYREISLSWGDNVCTVEKGFFFFSPVISQKTEWFII